MKQTVRILLHVLKSYGQISKEEATEYKADLEEIKDTVGGNEQALMVYMMKANVKLYSTVLNQYNQISTYEEMIRKLQGDIEILRNNPGISNGKLALQRETSANKKSYVSIDTIRHLKAAGLTTEEIASQLKVSRSTIWRREKEGK